MHMSTEIEKKSLEAHVELCAERYANLDNKLNTLDTRLNKMEEHVNTRLSKLEEHVIAIRDLISQTKDGSNNTIFNIGLTVVAALLGGILTFIFSK